MKTADVKAALRLRYPQPEWAINFEVGDATGAGRRMADAVAMNMYPSRGLAIHGFEIKVSRSDWLRELKNPDKSAPVQQYCDHWWIVSPENVVRPDELPPTWGHMVISDAGKIRTHVQAPKLDPVPITRAFTAAMVRRSCEVDTEAVGALVRSQMEAYQKTEAERIERAVKSRTARASELMKNIESIEQASGAKIDEWVNVPSMAASIRMVMESGVVEPYNSLRSMADNLTKAAQKAQAALAGFAEQGEAARIAARKALGQDADRYF